ncbi:hypothetical protein ACTMTJ_26210 [Phytohabitans sp. LJ34]|uniref:hypothetical protein n=1 Tax=Phytohabitans sp. LJ34 TaxID=3452217 RepID=UPI003F8A5E73
MTVEPNRSFATAVGAAPAAGEWWIVVQCFSLTEGKHVDEFVTFTPDYTAAFDASTSAAVPYTVTRR